MKILEGALYFYVGTLIILILGYYERVAGARYGYNLYPEVGLGPEILLAFGVAMVYYCIFVLIQYGLSRFCKEILDARYLLPSSFGAGIAVGFTFVSEFDFLFWILYRKDMGTILLSVLAVEILFALISFAIVRRTSRA